MALKYGGDYNPEQWPEDLWPEDIRLMQEAGVNFVTLGVFSWGLLEPTEGTFEFGWLDRILDLLHTAGITVDLATGTASPPAWMAVDYPEILPEDEFGIRRWPGSRQHYAPTSPVFRRFAARLTRKMAERYGSHPAVVMWHINNEYGCHTNIDYSDVAAAAFRTWLEARYGDVGTLNAAWGTTFWAQRYTSFAQVLPPRIAPNFKNPTQMLDFQRFSSDALLECFLIEKEVLREITPDIPVTTNFIGAFKPVDYWKWAPHVDVVSDDSYPDPLDPRSVMKAAFSRDLMRSLGAGRPWLLMEQATGHVQWRATNARKATGAMQALSLQAVSRGADGINFFQWRQSAAGAEKFHTAMLPHSGTDTRIWRSVVELGDQLRALEPVEGARTTARVAIVLDWESWWALENDAHPQTLDYLAALESWYEVLYNANVAVDFAHPAADLGGYALVLAPQLYLVSETTAENLADYAAAGGTLLLTYYSAIVDGNDHAHLGGYLGGAGGMLQDAVGVTIEEFAPLALEGETGRTVSVSGADFGAATGSLWSEFVTVGEAAVVANFDGGDLDGRAAITCNAHGAGSAWYVATQLDDEARARLLDRLLTESGVTAVVAGLPHGVEAQRRGDTLFLINQGESVAPTGIGGADLLTGIHSSAHTLAPRQAVALDVSKGS